MIERYTYSEPIFTKNDDISDGLSLEKNDSAALRIFRLLTGTCKIQDLYFKKIFKMDVNYLKFPYVKNTRFKKDIILESFSDDARLSDLSKYFRKLKTNQDFYQTIEYELLNCLTSRKQEKYLEAFFFLYRVLEGISYSIPLIYVSKSKSFNRSFASLQKFMPTKASEGELLFFRNFIETHWAKKSFYKLTLDIDISGIEVEELRPIYFNLYKSKAKDCLVDESEDEELKISFVGFLKFMIEIRNRYFHFLQGGWQENIKTSNIIFPDLFFKPIIDLALNWVATAMFEVINFDVENHE
ncbi:hypothetical protein [Collimonas fungivorans]|uniref:Uncharacterized protein n=1 Tax=Collimonas fungivorans (strain Ter331) TaxID=1005048 RepID=G0AIP1_COLFT|nr:hypothetical protein [Collimonas fungivorans]AEK60824.1 hypothetical protein CFU_0992 [Collimonas fungivorans Ter331]